MSNLDSDEEVEERPRHPTRLPPWTDRTQEFQDYCLSLAELKGHDLEDLSERLGVPLDQLLKRQRTEAFSDVRVKVQQSTMAGTVCRLKLAERQVELIEAMIAIALDPKHRDQAKMLLGLRDQIIPSGLQRSLGRLADSGAAVNATLASSMAQYVEEIEKLEQPKRTIDTQILSGKAALPTASRMKPDDDDDG